ncbi:MAG: hypothetical protein ACI4UE_03995 [Candidatus Scatovivens sp.]
MESKEIMNKKDYKYRKILFELLALILFIILAIAITPKEFQNDTFYTIKCGEYIFQNGILNLTQDPFSWIELPYTFPHWLYDLGIFAIFSKFVYEGIYISTIVLATILGLFIYKTCEIRSKNKVVSLILALLATYAMNPYITARAQLVTFILFLFELYSIEKLIETNKKRYLIYLILIPLLITQLHCAVFPMFFVLALPYIAEYILVWISDLYIFDKLIKLIFKILRNISKDEVKKEKYEIKLKKIDEIIEKSKIEKQEKRNNPYKIKRSKNKIIVYLLITVIIASVTGLINPTGTGAYTYIIKTYKGNTTFSINEHLPLTLINNKEFSIALIAFILILLLSDLKIRLSDFFMLAGLTYLSFKSARQISLFIIMCTPILAKLVSELVDKIDEDFSKKFFKFSTSTAGIIIIILLMTIYGEKKYKNISGQAFVNSASYPIEASEWIKENLDLDNLKLYNEYNYGSYLLLQGIPVFIDSRCDLYTPQFNGDDNLDVFSDALSVPDLNESYEKIFNKYGINYAILYSNNKACKLIDKDNNYSKIYEDDYFVIYEKLDAKVKNGK